MTTAAPQDHPVVPTRSGPVRGERRAGGLRFLGIPYAQPPVGDLRFAAPVPPRPWTEVLDATAYGPTAQRRPFADVTTIPEPTVPGEGVLNLNVFTPDADPRAALPVLVWIHGGGYVAGCSASPWYDGAAFNRDGVVLVSAGYRLGVEGFLHLADAPDNRGVRDWIAALEWVRDNIAAFGGDPAKVTVAGQSAGGGAVQTLLATPAAHGLFRAAISASGAVMRPQDRETARAASRLFAERAGVPATAAALRDATDQELLAFQDALDAPGPGRDELPPLLLGPFADGELIPVTLPEALVGGDAGTDVPLLIGFTAHEFAPETADGAEAAGDAAPGTDAGTDGPALSGLLAELGLDEEHAARFLAHHEAAGRPADPRTVGGQAITDLVFRAPAVAIADARAARGLPTWLYQFEWSGTAPGRAGQAYHCIDLPFAFDLLDAEGAVAALGEHPPQRLAEAVHGAWVAFVRDLDPGRSWPRYADDRATMLWDAEPRVEQDPLRAVREIWLD
ncbi:carboxylesterase family protein [Streptomyces sp. CB01881]|uniref:carboxylesterase/lipase family protein n=1 Tax=Streptomyces sp. CB01881 TaxID=2078691 RepID=UPI000CDC3BA9|nr:carboxylesterase family protein [Streptomyces sp. CB01881]AUY52984.1 carboxylesterase [Streptomyces sp. CB01881]TYC70699.1 carboxylesterase/lipase family protein [Streptomyces sp. CB01881]